MHTDKGNKITIRLAFSICSIKEAVLGNQSVCNLKVQVYVDVLSKTS